MRYRYFLLVAAVAVVLIVVFSLGGRRRSTSTIDAGTPGAGSPTATGYSGPDAIIVADPKDMVLPADAIAGNFTTKEGSIVTAQWSRSWQRDPADPGAASGASFITINTALEKTIDNAVADFQKSFAGDAGGRYVQQAIQLRGFSEPEIKVNQADVGSFGANEQIALRAAFARTGSNQTFVQYFVFMRIRNTITTITAFAPNQGATEAPNLLTDLKQVAKQQADRLLAMPTSKPG